MEATELRKNLLTKSDSSLEKTSPSRGLALLWTTTDEALFGPQRLNDGSSSDLGHRLFFLFQGIQILLPFVKLALPFAFAWQRAVLFLDNRQ